MSETSMAIGSMVVIVGGVLALLFRTYLEYRQNVAQIAAGRWANPDETTGLQRVLGWKLGFGTAGLGLFVASLVFGLPGETDNQDQGVSLVLSVVGAMMLLYVFLASPLRR